MKNTSLLLAAILAFAAPAIAREPGDTRFEHNERKPAGSSYEGHEAIESGEAGVRAGTALYNAMNKDKPLPTSGGNVATDSVRNVGSGQGLGEAWRNAAAANAGTARSSKPSSSDITSAADRSRRTP